MDDAQPKPLAWVGSSHQDLTKLPGPVQDDMGFALYLAQTGRRHRQAKPLSGFGGASVLEVVDDYDGDTYRAVYTVRFAERVYVLHVFQKKSRHGLATPAQEMDTVRRRLRDAEHIHHVWLAQHKNDAGDAE